MAAEDWMGDLEPFEAYSAECRYCGKAGLHWEEVEPGRWRLYTDRGLRHQCDRRRVDRTTASDFEALDP